MSSGINIFILPRRHESFEEAIFVSSKIVSDFAFKTHFVLPTSSKAYCKVLHTKGWLKYLNVLSQQSLFRIRFNTTFAAIFWTVSQLGALNPVFSPHHTSLKEPSWRFTAHSFLRPDYSFSLYGPTLSWSITFVSFFPAVNWLTSGFLSSLLNWLTAVRAVYKPFAKHLTSEGASNSDARQRSGVLNNRFIANFFTLVD